MGTNNRQRRAAKAKQQAKQQARRTARDGWRHRGSGGDDAQRRLTARERIRALLHVAASEPDTGHGAIAVETLAEADATLVDREAEDQLLAMVAVLWSNGWQPAELIREGRRADARIGRLLAAAVAVDDANRDPATLHARWSAQIAALDLPEVSTGWVAAFGRREWLDRLALVGTVATAVGTMYRAGRLHTIVPPPGARSVRSMAEPDPAVHDPVLVRVRALLAQAESTNFEAEAEAFTAKAQELMARHAIDTALLWATTERDERPTSIRLPIDDPYADIKSLLLQRVANRSRCTAVWDERHAMSTVVGFASDVAGTELLFTSLLVQSQSAMQAEGAAAGPGARARSRRFRSSFLMAFAHRIDQRLAEIKAAVERAAEAETSGSLLPVLVSRDDAVRDTVAELFGSLASSVVRGGSDAAGWARGTLAADLAELNAGRLVDESGPRAARTPAMLPGL